MTGRFLPALAGLAAFLAIALGSFGSHALSQAEAKAWAATATSYLLLHAVAVFAIIAWRDVWLSRLAAALMLVGALLFAGTLYALAFGASHRVAIMAPIGGTGMIMGWAFITVCALGRSAD